MYFECTTVWSTVPLCLHWERGSCTPSQKHIIRSVHCPNPNESSVIQNFNFSDAFKICNGIIIFYFYPGMPHMQGHVLHLKSLFLSSDILFPVLTLLDSCHWLPASIRLSNPLFKNSHFFLFFWFSLFSAKTNRDMYVGQYMNHNIPCFLHRKQATPSALPLNYSINNDPWKDCWMAPSSAGLVTPINNELPTNSVWGVMHVAHNTS